MYALALEDRVRTSQPFIAPLRALKSLASDRPQLMEKLAIIPEELAETKVPSLPELAESFAAQKPMVRRAFFLPGDLGSENFFTGSLASFFAYITLPLRGNVEGNDPDSILARAEYFISRGNLRKAVETLEDLDGAPKQVLDDWLKRSSHHLVVTKFITDIRDSCSAPVKTE